MADEVKTKPFWKSKTFWTNVITAVVIPALPPKYGVIAGMALGAANVPLRAMTDSKITLANGSHEENSNR